MTSGPDAVARTYQRLIAASVRDRKAQATLLGIRPRDVDALRLIAEGEPMRPSQLAEAIALSMGGLTALLGRLETAGLITRTKERHVTVSLSDAGRAVMAEERDALARAIGRTARGDALESAAQTLLAVARDRAADLAANAAEHVYLAADCDLRLPAIVRWG